MTAYDEGRFRDMESAGHSLARIAAEFGVTPRTVSRWRDATGLRHQPPHPAAPDSARQKAADLLADGCSLSETARTVGVTGPTIRRWFPDHPAWSRVEVGQHAHLVTRLGKDL